MFHGADVIAGHGHIDVGSFVFDADGENWTEIFQTQSSGNISRYETFGMPQITARYIRIEGSGNTENSWNSINEVIIYGN